MYGDVSMREYLIHAIQVANQNAMSLLRVNKVEEAKIHSTRFDILKQLLEKGKQNFVHFEKINREKTNETSNIEV